MAERKSEISLEDLYRAFDPSTAETAWKNKESGGAIIDQDEINIDPTRPAIGSNLLPTGNGAEPTRLEEIWRDRR